ncbi:alpha/beta fold hydrolase [Algoriphagus sanaruensis]|uniref:Alpha/beta hydrolase n=1 Tax=Algoriphagus sanaruensis TaxID=1727163 RepID=A0A142ENE8_9BACT|nr:alpha/beta hydrolase [Algoriphagus sanaruensis]AMQ56653.1 alpha/beta hydrolase [Algoriphagus sanaruensis]
MSWFNQVFKISAIILLSLVFFLMLLFRSDIPAVELEEKYWTPQSHFVEVDGVNLHVRFLGEGDPIFLLHGSFASLHTWDVWQQELSPYFMTISVDFPGHGLTGPDLEKRYSTLDYSKLILKLADKLQLPRFHLAGNSMGGGVALQIASDHPDRVLSLNLVDAAGAPQFSRTVPDSIQTNQRGGGAWIFKLLENPLVSNIFLKCTPKFLFAMNMKEVYGDEAKVNAEVVDRYYELMLREGNRQATLDRLRIPKQMNVNFEKLTMPTLILWGGKDSWIPLSQGQRLKDAITGSNLVVFEEAGHVPMEEIPTETVSEYLRFLGVEVRKNYLQPPKQLVYAD